MTSYSGTTLSMLIKSRIEANASAIIDDTNSNTYGIFLARIDNIFYGDQRILTGGAIVCVEPTRKVRDWVNTGDTTQNDFETSIIIYVDGDSGVENVQLGADLLTEAIENFLNRQTVPSLGGDLMGGLVTQGLAGTSTEHGYRIPSSQTVRANRSIYRSMSRTLVYEA